MRKFKYETENLSRTNQSSADLNALAQENAVLRAEVSLLREEKRKAENAFAERIDSANHLMHLVLDQLPMDIAVFDAHHRYLYVNPCSVVNADMRSWLIGKDDFQYCQFREKPIEIAEQRRKQFLEAKDTRKMVQWIENLENEKGKSVVVLRHLTPHFSSEGILSHMVGYAIDVTREMEARRTMENAMEMSERSEIMRKSFLSRMTHEIRTPLNAIAGITDTLIMENPGHHQTDYLNALDASTRNLMDIVDRVLNFSDAQSKEINLGDKAAFKPYSSISKIVELYTPMLHHKPVVIQTHVSSDIPVFVHGHEGVFAEVLSQLIDNAVKYTERGKIDIILNLIGQNEEEILVQCIVSDTGIGIASEEIPYLFESFSPAISSPVLNGMGLGLHFVKRLIDKVQGDIQVERNPEGGSKFIVDLTWGTTSPKRVVDYPDYGHKRILVAEDNSLNRLVIDRALKAWNIIPQFAMDGAEALDKLMNDEYDLVFMDLLMPEKNGCDVVREYFAHLPQSKTNIVALTANAFDESREEALESGMVEFMTKPVSKNYLSLVLDKYLGDGLSS